MPQIKFEYIWSNDTLSGYRITSYDIVTDDNGNDVIDDEGNIVTEINNDSIFVVNMLYNEDGEALGVNCHSELEGVNKSLTFLFVKDAQGNVVSISALEGGYFSIYHMILLEIPHLKLQVLRSIKFNRA